MNTRLSQLVLLSALLVSAASLTAQQPRPRTMPVTSSGDRASLIRTDEDGQPARLPELPTAMSVIDLRAGDAIFRGKGGCVSCHGRDATGVPGKGSSLTAGLNYIPKPYSWAALDSLQRHGIPESITRTNVRCPVRGRRGDLRDDQVSRVAAYVWAIAQVRGEPWPGGHRSH